MDAKRVADAAAVLAVAAVLLTAVVDATSLSKADFKADYALDLASSNPFHFA